MSTTAQAMLDDWPDEVPRPPSLDELPIDVGEPVDSAFHGKQMTLQAESLEIHFEGREDVYIAANMGIFYSALQAHRPQKHRAPDVFVATGADQRERRAWAVWEEDGRVPEVVVEVSSPSTSHIDREEKKAIYERIGVRYYYIHDPMRDELLGYQLAGRLVPMEPDASGRLPCPLLGLRLGFWFGTYRNMTKTWSRWYTDDGVLLPTPEELGAAAEARSAREAARAEQEAARAEQEAARAEQEAARAAELAARLAAYEAAFGQLPGGAGDGRD